MRDNEVNKTTVLDKEGAWMAAADFLMAVCLICISLVGAYFSLRMPSPGGWYTSPALFPLFVFSGLTFMAFVLLVGSVKTKLGSIIDSIQKIEFSQILKIDGAKRLVLIIFAVFIYIYVLLGFLFFEMSTISFLTFTLLVFSKLRLRLILCISFLFTMTASFSLTMFMKTLLPGDSLLWLLLQKVF
jgi:hypothetical protein